MWCVVVVAAGTRGKRALQPLSTYRTHRASVPTARPQLCPGSKVQRYVNCAAAGIPDACRRVKGCAWSDSTAYDNSTLSYIIGESTLLR